MDSTWEKINNKSIATNKLLKFILYAKKKIATEFPSSKAIRPLLSAFMLYSISFDVNT